MTQILTNPWKEEPPTNIIVRMPNWLGDMVMATPILRDIRRQWPDAHITAMCQSGIASLLQYDPSVDEVLAFKRRSGWIHRHFNRPIIDRVRKGNHDLGILTTNSFSSAWWFWRAGIPYRVGYKNGLRDRLLTHALDKPANLERMHHVEFYKRLLRPFGMNSSTTVPRIYVTQEELDQAKECLRSLGVSDHHMVVGVNPGAAYGPAKQWQPERFKAVIERLLEDPTIRILVFGDAAGEPLARSICAGLPTRVINLAGRTTLREFAAMAKLCHTFLTNDSGPMHLAAALRVPLVALFGSTSPTRTCPYEWGTVIYKNVSCSPCYKRVCPIDFRCMTRIEVDEVTQEVERLLRKAFEFRE